MWYVNSSFKRKAHFVEDQQKDQTEIDRLKRLARRAELKRLRYAAMPPEEKQSLLLKHAEQRRIRAINMTPQHKQIYREIHADQEWARLNYLDISKQIEMRNKRKKKYHMSPKKMQQRKKEKETRNMYENDKPFIKCVQTVPIC